MKQVIFTLSNARSGTLFLRSLFRRNIRNCSSRHEPFFDWGNPTLLGPAIYDAFAGRLDKLRVLLARKRGYVERLPGNIYLESSHAFLKSAFLVALEFFPELQLIHLIRDPLKVAKSEAYRETWRRRVRAPLHYYRADDGHRYFFWSLTMREEIFRSFDQASLTLFQRYLIQWVEIENRAMTFLDEYQLHSRCFTLQVPRDLNSPECVGALFEFFGLPLSQRQPVLRGRTNQSLGRRTTICEEDEREAEEVFKQIPEEYLAIFDREPYRSQSWSRRLRRTNQEVVG